MGFTREQKEQMIKSVKFWYHTIDLGDGFVTPGWKTIKEMNKTMLDFLPASFEGMSVLDIGCWDGLFSFEAERRGATRVLGIDNLSSGDGFTQEDNAAVKSGGFTPLSIAKSILNSNVEYREKNVYDLSPQTLGTFDCTIFFGVLYHLWHPMLALQRIREVTTKCLFIETHVNEEIDQTKPLIHFYPRGEKYEKTTWTGPNLLALYEMLRVVGFEKVLLYRFRDQYERAIGIAFVEERFSEDFQSYSLDERLVKFEPSEVVARLTAGNEEKEEGNASGRLQKTDPDLNGKPGLITEEDARIRELQADIDALKKSLSWRITEPLRWIYGKFLR